MIAALKRSGGAATSPIAIYKSVLALRRKRHSSLFEAEVDVLDFLSAAGEDVVPVEAGSAHGALEAFSVYGKGTKHPAQLNLADCFVYAQAKAARAALLFKGDDFSKTDIEAAI